MSTPPAVVAVVDDDVNVLKSLGRLLSSRGYRVRTFMSAEQYLENVDTTDASCVIIDVNLGDGMSGLELARAISSSEGAAPIIFMTASAAPATRKEASAIGCVAFLEKPFPSELLFEAILTS